MSCIATIKSPINGKPITSPAYYQLTSFFNPSEGKKIYEALTTEVFKVEFGFDWTKPHIGVSEKINYAGEPKMSEINRHLRLKMTEEELRSAEQIEEIGSIGYLGKLFDSPKAFENILLEIQLNPKFDMIDAEVISVGKQFQLSVKPVVTEKQELPITKEMLNRFGFPEFIVDGVQDFNNATFKELVDNLLNSSELEPHQREMLSKLSPLIGKNTKLKLALFDDIGVASEYQRSFYDPKTNTVYIAKSVGLGVDKKFLAREIIHEAVHAFTVEILKNPRNATEVKFVQDIERYFNTYKTYYPEFQDEYGFKNVDEFVAEFLSNPHFRHILQEAELHRTKNTNFIDRMWNTIKGFLNKYVFNSIEGTMYDNVQETLNDYFDYLMTLQDYPESPAETQIRFSQPFSQRGQKPYISEKLSKFYSYVDQNVDSTFWKQLSQSFSEISPEFQSIRKLQEAFGKISTSDVQNSLLGTVRYVSDLANLLNRVEKDVINLTKSTDYYTPEELLKKYNSAVVLAQGLKAQMNFFQENVVTQLGFNLYKNSVEDERLEVADKKLKAQVEVPVIDEIVAEVNDAIQKATKLANSIEDISSANMADPVAATVAEMFSKIAADMQKPNHPIREEKRQLEERLARTKDNSYLQKKIQKEIDDLDRALNFIPTKENILKLLNASNDQSLRNASVITRYFGVGGMTGVPILDIVNAFINNHVTAATNKSLEMDTKIRSLQERINVRNKREGIGRSLLGAAQFKKSKLGEFYEGFYRVVPIKYYDDDGNVKIITQTVYNTPMKEAEFQNDLADLKYEITKAKTIGDLDAIKTAEDNLKQFLEDYAQQEFVPEYYEADKLLTDEAREARQELQDDIDALTSVFGNDDLDVTVTNPVRGSASGTQPTIREERGRLRRAYARLGSIYNEDGSEKPVGSKERRIADSIINYNKARRGLDIIEFVLTDDTFNKFNQIKERLAKDISQAQANIAELQSAYDDAELSNDIYNMERLAVQVNQAKEELKVKKEAEQKWLDQNTRTEILPKFFELQQAISDQIRTILSKYGENPEVTEKYEKLFNAVRGFRDQDGVIEGTLVGEGLTKTIQELEQEIEDLKAEVKESQIISEEDKALLKNKFRELHNLQIKVETPYYKETAGKLKDQVRSSLTAEERQALNLEAIKQAEHFLQNKRFKNFELFDRENFESSDEFEGGSPDDFAEAESDLNKIIAMFNNLLTEVAVNNKYRQTDWYKNNHIDVSYEVQTGDVAITPDGKTIPITKTVVEKRPIYIWRKTVPSNRKYIRQNSPSFEWSVPRIRPEYKNPNYRFLGDYRPKQNAKDNKYVNPEYENLGQEDKAIMDDILQVYEDQQRLLPVGQRLKAYIMPNIGKESKEEQIDFYKPAYKVYNFFRSFFVYFKENTQASEQDEEVGMDIIQAKKLLAGNIRAGKVRLIKTRYKQPLSHNQSTDNILGALSAFGTYAAEFDGLKSALPAIFAIRDKYAQSIGVSRSKNSTKIKDTYQKFKKGTQSLVKTAVETLGVGAKSTIQTAIGATDTTQGELILDSIEDQISRFFYGAELRSGSNEATRALARVGSRLLNTSQKYAMQYNIMRVFKNMIANILNAFANTSKFGLSRQELLKGMVKGAIQRSKLVALDQGFTEMDPYLAKLIYFRGLPVADPTQLYKTINSGYLMRRLNADNFGAQVFGSTEAMSTIGIYEAVMEKSYVPYKDPNTGQETMIKIADAYDFINNTLVPKDGVMGIDRTELNTLVGEQNQVVAEFLANNGVSTIKELPPVKQVQLSKLLKNKFETKVKAQEKDIGDKIAELKKIEQEVRDKIFQLYTSTQGNYFRRGRSHYESVLALKYLMSLKRYFFPQLRNKYGNKAFLVTTGKIEEGMYNTFLNAMNKKLASLRLQGAQLSMDYGFTEREREAGHRAAVQSATTAALWGLSYLLITAALKAQEDDEESYLDWLLPLLGVISLGSLDEFAGMDPVIWPTTLYNKIKTDPLKKAYEDKGPIDALRSSVSYAWFGMQSRAWQQQLEGYGILAEYGEQVGSKTIDWMTGKGTASEIFNNPYYERSRGGKGYEIPYARVPFYTGKSKFLVGYSKVTGAELSVKSMAIDRKLEQQLKFTPVIGMPNPQGRYNEINSRISKLKDKFMELRSDDIDQVRDVISLVDTPQGERLSLNKKALKTLNLSKKSSMEYAAIFYELGQLSTEKDVLSRKYRSLFEYDQNLRVSQKEGRLLSTDLEQALDAFTGYVKEKHMPTMRSTEVLEEVKVMVGTRAKSIGKERKQIDTLIRQMQSPAMQEEQNMLLPD
jgi:transcription initiation factor TFIIIB Brf1 subunit/transcription initiation factor TFIIB